MIDTFRQSRMRPRIRIMVDGRADLTAYHQSIVELVNKNRPPAMYPYRDYLEAGGLMAYDAYVGEAG
jgi:putative ABC transport system substrate-binding protein